MRRSRRVYQAPDNSDTSVAASDVENGDVSNKKKNVNDDPSQPLRGGSPRRTAAAAAAEDGMKQVDAGHDDKRAELSDDGEATNESSSSVFSRCLCCWRRRSDTDSIGENGEFSLFLYWAHSMGP